MLNSPCLYCADQFMRQSLAAQWTPDYQVSNPNGMWDDFVGKTHVGYRLHAEHGAEHRAEMPGIRQVFRQARMLQPDSARQADFAQLNLHLGGLAVQIQLPDVIRLDCMVQS